MFDYIRELPMVEKDFYAISQELKEPERTRRLVDLMNELEANYNTFKISPTQEELQKPAMILYRKISMARAFD